MTTEQTVITISDLEKGTHETAHVLKRKLNGCVVDLIADGKVMSAVKPDALAKLNLSPDTFTHRKGVILQDLVAEADFLRSQNQMLTGKLKKLADENQLLAAENKTLAGENQLLTGQLKALADEALGLAAENSSFAAQESFCSNEQPALPGKRWLVFTDASASLYAMNYIVAFIAVLSIMTSLPNLLGLGISLPVFLMWHSTIQFLRGRSAQEYERVRGVFVFGLFIIAVSEVIFHWVGFNLTLSDTSVEVAQELFGVGKWGQSLFIALLFTFIQLTAIAINMRLKAGETE